MNAFTPIVAAALSDRAGAAIAAAPQKSGKWPIPYQAIEPIIIATDIVTILFASLLADFMTRIAGDPLDFGKSVGLTIIVSSLFVCMQKIRGLYRPTELLAQRNQILAIAMAWTLVLVLLAVAVGALGIRHEIPRSVSVFTAIGICMLIALRVAAKRLLSIGLNGHKFASRNVILISDPLPAPAGGSDQTFSMLGCSVVESFTLPHPGAGFGYRKWLSARVIDYVRGSEIEEIFIAAELARWAELRSFVGDLRVLPFPITFIPVGAAAEIFRRPTRHVGNGHGVELQRGPLSVTEYVAKRAFDLVFAGLALLLLSPVFAAAALAVKIDSSGPILFKQKRCGFNGRSFSILKFRTMFVLEDGPSIVQALPADKRVTRVGKWLRRSSIDELPQLFNVLDGSMSLVGPRPHALAHDGQFDKEVRNYAFRRSVKPGLTGWAQIHGCRGATPTTDTIERRVQYDLWYIDNWNLRLDFMILLQTPGEVVRARNAV